MNDFNRNTKLFCGPMAWVGGVPGWDFGIVKITNNGKCYNLYFGLTLIGGN